MEMPSTPSLCCTPIVIYSSSDDESTGLFANDDNNQHATPIPSECSSVFSTAGVALPSTDSSSSVVSSIANLLCTDSSNTTTVSKAISYRGSFSAGSGHGSLRDITRSPYFLPAQPIKTRYPSTMFSNV